MSTAYRGAATRKATIVTSDEHYGDQGQLLGTLRAAMACAVDLVRDFAPGYIQVIKNGDAVAGRGIFREQGLQNAVQLGASQVWFAAHDYLKLHKDLAAIAPVEWTIVQGNHDFAQNENLATQLAQTLVLLGVPARFAGRTYIGNFASPDRAPVYYEASHGFSGSRTYANGPAEILTAMRKYIEMATLSNLHVKRFLRGHVHWLSVGQVVGLDTLMDTTGGWHRNERLKLPHDLRDTGLLVYLHDGDNLTIKEIHADLKLLQAETESRTQHYDVMAEAAAALKGMAAWAVDKGIA